MIQRTVYYARRGHALLRSRLKRILFLHISRMSIEIGDEIPQFNLDSQMGQVSLHDLIHDRFLRYFLLYSKLVYISFISRWCLLLSLRSAFDPVTTTEIASLHRYALHRELERRNITLITVGCDTGTKQIFFVHYYRKLIPFIFCN